MTRRRKTRRNKKSPLKRPLKKALKSRKNQRQEIFEDIVNLKSFLLLAPLAVETLHFLELLLPLVGVRLVLVLKPNEVLAEAPV